jgi:hypothetical protein
MFCNWWIKNSVLATLSPQPDFYCLLNQMLIKSILYSNCTAYISIVGNALFTPFSSILWPSVVNSNPTRFLCVCVIFCLVLILSPDNLFNESKYSETSIYRSRIIRFPRSVLQFLWSLSESYINYGSRIHWFFFRSPDKTINRRFTVYIKKSCPAVFLEWRSPLEPQVFVFHVWIWNSCRPYLSFYVIIVFYNTFLPYLLQAKETPYLEHVWGTLLISKVWSKNRSAAYIPTSWNFMSICHALFEGTWEVT